MAEAPISAKKLRTPEQRARIARRRSLVTVMTKRFEDLSVAEKDALLKEVAIRLGLIQDPG